MNVQEAYEKMPVSLVAKEMQIKVLQKPTRNWTRQGWKGWQEYRAKESLIPYLKNKFSSL